MRILGGKARLSATDLANHLGCAHLTSLDFEAAHGRLAPPSWHDPALEALQQRGFQHEAEYLDHLRGLGLSVVEAKEEGGVSAVDAAIAAMRAGADVITQAPLAQEGWYGRADVLRRVPRASDLGPWSYEVVDTKLARETRAGTILQLCFYSDALRDVQGILPDQMHVVAPGTDFEPETFRTRDFLAYYRFVKGRLFDAVSNDDGLTTYPDPVPHCDTCRWWSACDNRRREDDHLSLVAGISKLQRRELEPREVETLTTLAQLPIPLEWKPSRGGVESYIRVREQARVQLEGREQDKPVYELLDLAPERGLARLPEPSKGDIFFDIEGDPFVGTGGLEYLHGWVVTDEPTPLTYRSSWAIDADEEKAAFEAFVDEVVERWKLYPDLHIYHFAPYEPGAMKRLMGRYATREEEIDRMLRAGLFVDLHSIVKQALRASVERYSIKDLEQFYGYKRDIELRDASKKLRAFERALELDQVETVPDDVREAVEAYNRDDCVSTFHLRDWLESLRTELVDSGEDIPRPTLGDGEPPPQLDERQQRVRALAGQLLEDVPTNAEERTEEQHAAWLLAHMLEWHRREAKAPWWEFFRLAELGDEELVDERAGLANLEFIERVGGTDKCPVHRYHFDAQDTDIEADDDLRKVGGDHLGKVAAIDTQGRFADIKKRGDTSAFHPTACFTHSVVNAKEQPEALARLAEWVAGNNIDCDGPHRAARDLLLARRPRLKSPPEDGVPLQQPGEQTLAAAKRLALELEGGVLAIQGPPGAGKTYTGARMICELVRAGKKVGITAVSHKVIRNLLDGVVEAAKEEGLEVRCIQKVGGKATPYEGQPIRETTKNPDVIAALAEGEAQVAAGTSWLWAREDLFQSIDVLFVDEAGQMSLANVVAVAQAANSVVLLGDP